MIGVLKEIYLGSILVLMGLFTIWATIYSFDDNYLKAIYSLLWAILLELFWVANKLR